jgi:ABC-type multidrug transport system fused ATPase/permease subunit
MIGSVIYNFTWLGIHVYLQMLRSILRAPLSFFELTPMGRVLNLFSRDIYVVDSILGRVIQSLFKTFVQVIGMVALYIARMSLLTSIIRNNCHYRF